MITEARCGSPESHNNQYVAPAIKCIDSKERYDNNSVEKCWKVMLCRLLVVLGLNAVVEAKCDDDSESLPVLRVGGLRLVLVKFYGGARHQTFAEPSEAEHCEADGSPYLDHKPCTGMPHSV